MRYLHSALFSQTQQTLLSADIILLAAPLLLEFQTAHLVTAASPGWQDSAARQDGVARQAAHALAAFDAGLEPLREALDPCRHPVPPCRRPSKRRHLEGPGAMSGPGVQSGPETQATALEALAARVAAATRFPVVLACGSSGSSNGGRTSASSAPCALNLFFAYCDVHETLVQHCHNCFLTPAVNAMS